MTLNKVFLVYENNFFLVEGSREINDTKLRVLGVRDMIQEKSSQNTILS